MHAAFYLQSAHADPHMCDVWNVHSAVCSAGCSGRGYLKKGPQALCCGRRRIAMSQRRARKAQKLGPAPAAVAAGTPALAAQENATDVEPGWAGLVQEAQPEGTRAADPGQPGAPPDGPAVGKQSRKRRGARRAGSEETRRSLYHGVTWSRKVGKWRAQVRQA